MIKNYLTKLTEYYENLRAKNEKKYSERLSEIQKKIPEIKQIDDKITNLCYELAMNSLKKSVNHEEEFENLKNKILSLRGNKCELLVSNNYPMNYLDKIFDCVYCEDTGYVNGKKCSCYKRNLVKIYISNSELKDIIKENNFENFNIEYYSKYKIDNIPISPRENIEHILDRSLNFTRDFKTSNTNLLFCGNPGTGKTFVSQCIANEVLQDGNLVIYRTSDELIKELSSVRFENNSELNELLTECDLLIIDDLGTETITEYSRSSLFNLLNKRILQNKSMIISTNYDLRELPKIYSSRITSRLFGNFTLCKFYGEDIRVKKNLEEKNT